MSKTQKVLAYAVGFIIGCVVLSLIPRDRSASGRHPWHQQTAVEGTYPMSILDDAGREVVLAKQPRHFISLAPSVTETLFAMELGDHLLAVTQWCDYPDEAKALRDAGASIGSMDQPDRETIAAYRPDLIIGTDLTPPEVYSAIESPPRTVAIVLKQKSLDDVIDDVRIIGKAAGVPGKALALIHRLEDQREDVRKHLEPFTAKPDKRVLFLLSIEPGGQPGWSPGKGTWVNDLIENAHARNVVADLGKSWGEISFESLLTLDPEVVLIRDGKTAVEQEQLRKQIQELNEHPVWKQVTAVRNNRVHILPHGPLNIPGPRIVDAYASIVDAVWEAQSGHNP